LAGGGALVTTGGSTPGVLAPSLDGAGQAKSPADFGNLLNLLGLGAKFGPGAAVSAGQLAQGHPVAAIGAGAATAAAGMALGKFAPAIEKAIPNPIARGLVHAVTSLGAGALGGQLASGGVAMAGQLMGGAQRSVTDAVNAAANVQREQGQSALSGKEVGLGGLSPQALQTQEYLAKLYGVNIPAQALDAQYQVVNKSKDADMGRQMMLNQQLGQLTGALNQQVIAGQLASGAQSEAGATTRTMLTANPYAQSVLQTGGIRGI
jgi:hypothetical protein